MLENPRKLSLRKMATDLNIMSHHYCTQVWNSNIVAMVNLKGVKLLIKSPPSRIQFKNKYDGLYLWQEMMLCNGHGHSNVRNIYGKLPHFFWNWKFDIVYRFFSQILLKMLLKFTWALVYSQITHFRLWGIPIPTLRKCGTLPPPLIPGISNHNVWK